MITPTVGLDTYRENNAIGYSQIRFSFPISIHKYLSDRFAVGLANGLYYTKNKAYTSNASFYISVSGINVQPEVRYNFLKSRFTPFVAGRIFDITYQSVFNDNPYTPEEFRRISKFYFNTSFQMDAGVSYFIKNRFGFQLKLADLYNTSEGIQTQSYRPFNFGLQFIINNPRQ